MGKSGIEYCDWVWNPWMGCTPVSEGCERCWAATAMRRWGKDPRKVVRASKSSQRFPLSKKVMSGERVFVCSWSDFFHKNGDHEWLCEAWEVMRKRPDVTFLILTKRPERITTLTLPAKAADFAHIWLGVTAENQEQWEERGLILSEIAWPGKKFISVEPMLSQIDDSEEGTLHAVDWVIAGGESGPNARPSDLQWFRDLRDQCVAAGVPYFLKQATIAGRLMKMPELDGRTWDQIPGKGK